jgi:hypothetical protein
MPIQAKRTRAHILAATKIKRFSSTASDLSVGILRAEETPTRTEKKPP